jgi:hypothetical protein
MELSPRNKYDISINMYSVWDKKYVKKKEIDIAGAHR